MKIKTWPCYMLVMLLVIMGVTTGEQIILAMGMIVGCLPAILSSAKEEEE